mgnify:CR=1 FL=1
MKKKIIYILTTAVITLTAFYIGRNTAPTHTTTKVIHTMPEKVDLSDSKQFKYRDTSLCYIIEWNTDGKELAIMTSAGYELYANKQETIYQPDIKQYIGINEFSSWNVDGNTLTITTTNGNTYTFNK